MLIRGTGNGAGSVFIKLYVLAFFIFLAAPLLAAGMFAFNESQFPTLPWRGFTLDWFFNDSEPVIGMFHDRRLLRGLSVSFTVASAVALLSVFVGTCNAFLFVRHDFPAKNFFYIMMVLPLLVVSSVMTGKKATIKPMPIKRMLSVLDITGGSGILGG